MERFYDFVLFLACVFFQRRIACNSIVRLSLLLVTVHLFLLRPPAILLSVDRIRTLSVSSIRQHPVSQCL